MPDTPASEEYASARGRCRGASRLLAQRAERLSARFASLANQAPPEAQSAVVAAMNLAADRCEHLAKQLVAIVDHAAADAGVHVPPEKPTRERRDRRRAPPP